MGVRSLVLVTALALLAAPGILAPSSDGPVVHRLAPLDAGGHYVYDVTLVVGEGAAKESWTTERQLTIDIGTPGKTRLLDGTVLDALAIEMHRAPAPWDLNGHHAHDGDGIRLSEGLPSRGVLVLALPDGAVVESRITLREGATHEIHPSGDLLPDGKHHAVIDRFQETRRHITPLETFSSGARPAMEWVETGSDDGNTTTLPVARQLGQLDGDRLHDLGGGAKRGDGPFACPTPAPRLPWSEPWTLPTRHTHDDEALTTTPHHVETWVRPGTALPALIVCKTRVIDENASLSVPVTVAWSLRQHVPGDAPVDIRWDADAVHPAKDAFSTTRVPTPPRLLYPLEEALKNVRHQSDGAFYSGPVAIENAEYRPQHWDMSDGHSVPEQTLHDLGKAAAPTAEPDAEPTWKFLLVNATGWTLEAETVRHVDDEGNILGESTETSPLAPPGGVAPARADDARAREILRTLTLSLHRQDLQTEAWERQTDAAFRYTRAGDGTSGPAIIVTTGDQRDGHQVPPRQETRRTEDGALVHERSGETGTSAHPEDPAAAPRPSSGTIPTVLPVLPDHADVAVKSGAAFGLALLLVYFWDVLKTLLAKALLLPLYAKLRKERLLDHKTRDDILQHVRNNPGAHKNEIRKVLAIGLGTASHHLDVLERNGLLTSIKAGRRRCYFLHDRAGKGSHAFHAVLSTDATRRVYRHILDSPGIRQRMLAERLGVSQTAVIFHARKLIAVGAVEKTKAGREVGYRPSSET